MIYVILLNPTLSKIIKVNIQDLEMQWLVNLLQLTKYSWRFQTKSELNPFFYCSELTKFC